MSYGVRTYLLLFKRVDERRSAPRDHFNQAVYPKPRKRFVPTTAKDRIRRSQAQHERLEGGHGLWPEWASPLLVALTQYAHRCRSSDREIGHTQPRCLVSS